VSKKYKVTNYNSNR